MAEVLLIEPDRLLAESYVQALQAVGHEVNAASGAQAAIMAADAIRPDLVVLELQLVEHSGIEFLYEFRSYPEWQDVPVIIHTHVPAAEFNDSRQILRDELGVHDYLYKPHTTLRRLTASVNEHLPVAVGPKA
ncbi:MAG TPA: response regulator [Candidatus Saccharimonadales bacterium]|nr:response regulator [Candidatus Saccharimonadales bacterium]